MAKVSGSNIDISIEKPLNEGGVEVIDTINGHVSFDGKKTMLHPGLQWDHFVQSDLYQDVVSTDNYGYTAVLLKLQSLINALFAVELIFAPHGSIWSITLSLAQDGKVPTWENWSEQAQLAKKRDHDHWLEVVLGNKPPCDYTWGKIFSEYDPRSGSSTITIMYLTQ